MAKRLPAFRDNRHPLARSDYHVHSTFSDDAVSTLAENIAAAESLKLETVRLIDHVRESTTWVPAFLAAVAAEEIPEQLEVLTGVEAKMMDVTGRLDIPADLGELTVVIADHQFPGTDGPWSPDEVKKRLATGRLRPADAVAMLFEAYTAAMRGRPGSQLAHPFSILPKVGLHNHLSATVELATEQQLEQFVTVAVETNTLVELNQKWGVSQFLPLKALLDVDLIVMASDAHEASFVGEYRREVLEPLDYAQRIDPRDRW
jgi:putative hydrolase